MAGSDARLSSDRPPSFYCVQNNTARKVKPAWKGDSRQVKKFAAIQRGSYSVKLAIVTRTLRFKSAEGSTIGAGGIGLMRAPAAAG